MGLWLVGVSKLVLERPAVGDINFGRRLETALKLFASVPSLLQSRP
jgi:hypothetical protein